MNLIAKVAVAAAVVVLVVVAVDVMVPRGGVGGPAPTMTPSSLPSPTAQSAAPSAGGDPTSAGYTVGRQSLTVDGVQLSFDVPTAGWELYGGLHISKSMTLGQGAEAVLFWAGFPDGSEADPCGGHLDDPRSHSSALALAAVVATADGTERVSGPLEVTIGGRSAQHVVLTVREDRGCDPGYFYNWKAKTGGAMWEVTRVGDTMQIWIVEVDRGLLFIAGITNPNGTPSLGEEIQQIVASIRFE